MKFPGIVLCDHRPAEAAYCQGSTDAEYKISRAKWVQDYSGMKDIEFYLYEYALEISKKQRWKTPKGTNYPQRFAALAVYELRHPERFIQKTPEKRNPENPAKIIHKIRAQFLGMESKNYLGHWRGRYEYVFAKAQDGVDTTFRIIWRNQVDIDREY